MDGRKHLSGAGYRKLTEEKRWKEDVVLNQTPKLESFFMKKVVDAVGFSSSENMKLKIDDSQCSDDST